MVELVALRPVAPRPAAQRLPRDARSPFVPPAERRRECSQREHFYRASIGKPRSLTITEIDVGPFLGFRDKPSSDRVRQDVVCLLPATFLASQAVLEEIVLPDNTKVLGGPFLPLADDAAHRLRGRRKRKQRVEVVGHEQEQIGPPYKLLLPMADETLVLPPWLEPERASIEVALPELKLQDPSTKLQRSSKSQ